MRPITVIALAVLAGLLTSQLPATAAMAPAPATQVEVTNFPDPQNVTGTVDVTNQESAAIRGTTFFNGSVVNPPPDSVHDLVTIAGPGKFVSAIVTKQGGLGITRVLLILDGVNTVLANVSESKNFGLTQNNPYGVVVLSGSVIDTIAIGFPQALQFETSLVLRVDRVGSGVVQILGRVIAGE